MSGRNIQKHLEKVCNVEVSPDLISRVTNDVIEEVREWQNRPLEKTCATVYLDALASRAGRTVKAAIRAFMWR
jgi:transposase-like protein